MKWEGKYAFYENLVATNKIKPEHLRPDVTGFGFYIDAFRELSTCRPSSFDVGPIPFTAVVEYAKIFEVGPDDFEEFLYVIRAMDSEFLKAQNKKAAPKNGPANPNKKH